MPKSSRAGDRKEVAGKLRLIGTTGLWVVVFVLGLAMVWPVAAAAPAAAPDARDWALPPDRRTEDEDAIARSADGAHRPPSSLLHTLAARVGLDGEAVLLYAKWVVGAPTLVVLIVLVLLLRPRRKTVALRPLGRPGVAAVSPPPAADAPPAPVARPTRSRKEPPASQPPVALPGEQLILAFFLELFRHQLGATADALAQIYLVETRSVCPNEIYEMRIHHGQEWETRRMSIGLLGQGGGSRSQCFYVIYDTHMVIKIPAVPVVRFGDYKRQIAAEGRILARLAPRECIVPRVSVILEAVSAIADSDRLPAEVLENRYMRMLEEQPELQAHLQLGGSFAFFMDLAKHYFLSTVLDEIHGGYGRLNEEARQHPELLWDQHGFVCRYGESAAPVCLALQEVYYRCEGRLRRLATQPGHGEVPAYHLKQWFLGHLVGDPPAVEEQSLPRSAMEQINQLLDSVVQENRRLVERYRSHLRSYIRETRFSRYRRPVEALAANLLDLLAWIGQKGLAMRDLKPENLFVAGNPDDYPGFLNNPDKFSIGLIDVETAVAIDAADPLRIAQPQLAGTPLYATPAHLMSNAILLEVYHDPALVLHLQDWHATIALLYKLMTGEHLFSATAHVFPEMINRLKVLDPGGPALADEVIRIQRLFWNSAVAEFQEGMARHGQAFARLSIAVPDNFVAEMTTGLRADMAEIDKAVVRAVGEQSFFNSGDKRRFLKEASAEKIGQMKNRLLRDAHLARDPILLFFELFEKLKTRQEEKSLTLAALSAPRPTMQADQLLEAMFQRVFATMYPSHWPALAPTPYGRRVLLDPDITTYQATM